MITNLSFSKYQKMKALAESISEISHITHSIESMWDFSHCPLVVGGSICPAALPQATTVICVLLRGQAMDFAHAFQCHTLWLFMVQRHACFVHVIDS